MKIVLARAAGFCMGVRRAMGIVLEQARHAKQPVMTHGPLIHNPQVIELLEQKGVRVLGKDQRAQTEKPGSAAPGAQAGTVVIRAHGITPDEKDALCGCGFSIVDATCPHVVRIQRLITKHVAAGDSVIIIGDKGHAEVEGLLRHARGRGFVVAREDDVEELPADLGQVTVVSQTTQNAEHFERLRLLIAARYPNCTIYRTICGSTDRRQRETVEVAREVDAMVVVGGRNSANTVRLAELAAETGTPTFHIETAEELDLNKLTGCRRVGLTAGASTPNWMIEEVTERLRELSRREWGLPRRAALGMLDLLLDTNLYLALGAVTMGYGCALLGGYRFGAIGAIAAFLYILGMYSLNIRYESRSERYISPHRWRFHQRWSGALLALGVAAIVGSVACSVAMGPWALGLMALANIAGVFYHLPLAPRGLMPGLPYTRLSDVPGSKDLFMGLAWAAVLTLLPVIGPDLLRVHWVVLILTFFYVFTLVFIRSVVFDFSDIQGDQMVGRETIPVVIGQAPTKVLLAILTGVLLVGMVGATVTGVFRPLGYVLLLPVLYTLGYLYLYHRRLLTRGTLFEVVLGGKFLLVGLLAGLWHFLTRN